MTPLFKKPNCDRIFKNYRPVSNLPYASKLIESAVANQLKSYLVANNLIPVNQSAYRAGHSTETALLKVQNDILLSMDSGNVVALTLLDLSAAFDTIDHVILLKRLKTDMGIDGTVLKWIASYLSDRSQCVSIDGITSKKRDLKFGVPQGSVLGPLLFSVYIQPLCALAQKHGLQLHSYADDQQVYISFKPVPQSETLAVNKLCRGIEAIKKWMFLNKLALNADKTEFILFGSRVQLAKLQTESILIDSVAISSVNVVRNLGVWFNSSMNMEEQVKQLCSSVFYHLRCISQIRGFLDSNTVKTLVQSSITSRLDYGNSLLFGVPGYLLDRLQRAQNAAAKLIYRARRFDHVTPILEELHWLPVRKRIVFKLCLIVFKCLNGNGPKYLSDLLSLRDTGVDTRCARDSNLLNVPKSKRITFGDRAFYVAAPKLWNSLPVNVRGSPSVTTFKKNLKTFLFTSD